MRLYARNDSELEQMLQEVDRRADYELKVLQGGGRKAPPIRGHLKRRPAGPRAPGLADRRLALLDAASRAKTPAAQNLWCGIYKEYRQEYPELDGVPAIQVYRDQWCR